MSKYHHHPDSLIYIRTPVATYSDTLDNFRLDFGRIWPLPEGIVELLYDDAPAGRHVMFDRAGSQLAADPRQVPFAKAAIAAIESLVVAQKKRNEPAPQSPAPPTPERKSATLSTGTRKV